LFEILTFTSFNSLTNWFLVSGQQLPLVQYYSKRGEGENGTKGGGDKDHSDIKAIGECKIGELRK
jgi:hypothetical protein